MAGRQRPAGHRGDKRHGRGLPGKRYPAIQGLCFAIGLITGIIGGLRIYIKWNVHGHRHHHIDAEIIGWMGSSIFLLLAALLMEMFNGG